MSTHYHRLIEFFKELRRRKVIQVITVYAAASFIVLELVDILAPSLRLPEWTLNLVLLLLCVGFVIAVILSWIFDIHPEGGIVKTEPAHKVKPEDIPKSSYSWKVASYISFVVIVGLIVLNIIPGSGKKAILDKSIAVLPFINDSPDEENTYFINGIQEAILDNLSKIEDLRVVSRTSVLKYIDDPKPIPQIAEEMNVTYILEGSGQKYGDQVRLTLQLIDARKDRHIWSSPFSSKLEVTEIFNIQSQIAQEVAKQIEVIITPEERVLIERIATTNQTAFDLVQKAEELMQMYYSDTVHTDGMEKAMELYHYAIGYDSAYVTPYVRLGWIYWNQFILYSDSLIHFKDSAIHLTNKALEVDPQFAEAYNLQGYIFRYEGQLDQSLASFDRANELNPNSGMSYAGKGWIYNSRNDYVNALDNFYRSIQIDRTEDNLISRYTDLSINLSQMGFGDLAEHYEREGLKLHGDTTYYFYRLALIHDVLGNPERSIDYALKGYARDPDWIIFSAILGREYLNKRQYDMAYNYYLPYLEALESYGMDDTWQKVHFAFVCLKNGDSDKAQFYLDKQIQQSEDWIENNRNGANSQYSFLAIAYAIQGEKERAIEYLDLFNQFDKMNIFASRYRHHPLFENISNEPDFQRLVSDMEAKYLEEHERVRQWLEENEML